MRNVLMLSLANQGYEVLYKRNIDSHRRYAKLKGYHYVCVTDPIYTKLAMEVAWLKIYLIEKALKAGYDWVMFVDADCEVKTSTPSIENVEVQGKYLYIAKGYSGQLNSGVLIIKNEYQAIKSLERIRRNIDNELLEDETHVGWGENDCVILECRNNPAVQVIGRVWNNNGSLKMNDFITHYSAGPLRRYFSAPLIVRLKFFGITKCLGVIRRMDNLLLGGVTSKHQMLKSLLNKVIERHPDIACISYVNN